MKKISIILSAALIALSLCACGSNDAEEQIPEIDPASLITAADVETKAGYVPVIDETGTYREGNTAQVFYRSEPVGVNDTVTVKITQFNDEADYQTLFDRYENTKSKRTDAEIIAGIGQEAYIAYPTIHVYDRGCIIEITAGSGSDDVQKALLTDLALTAASRLEEIVPDGTDK